MTGAACAVAAGAAGAAGAGAVEGSSIASGATDELMAAGAEAAASCAIAMVGPSANRAQIAVPAQSGR
jgi:hypothetical protein